MPLYPELLGLTPDDEYEDAIRGIVAIAAREGKAITGYYGLPYINKEFGSIQLVLRTEKQYDGKKEFLNITGVDTHAVGHCVWNVALISTGLTTEGQLARTPLVKRTDNMGFAIINIINADVLPSYQPDDIISLQVVGIPASINYFADEDQYQNSLPENARGIKTLLAEGMVCPLGLLNGSGAVITEDDPTRDLLMIRSTVKYLSVVSFELTDEISFKLLRCTMDTEFGPLEVIHPFEAVDEDQRGNLKEGATVFFIGRLSGDAAIYDYGEGVILDEEHCLFLLRDIICGDIPDRMRSILTDNAGCITQTGEISGREDIIRHFYTYARRNNIAASTATVTQVLKDTGAGFGIGKRCIAVSYDDGDTFSELLFINTDKAGGINKIIAQDKSVYRVEIDKSPLDECSFWNNIYTPESVAEPIFNRAKYYSLLPEGIKTPEGLANFYDSRFKENADRIAASIRLDIPEPDKALANVFGYSFAKAIEAKFNAERPNAGAGAYRYVPEDAFNGVIAGELGDVRMSRLESALGLGMQFYNDLKFFHETVKDGELFDLNFWEHFEQALIIVQCIGAAYSQMYMADGGGGLVS